MDFPLNGQRKSGFLAPIFGGTIKGGTEVTLPFYWNIAPNFDATLAPREMTKRGLMLNNEFRYLEPGYGGEVHVDVLPNDAIANRTRALFSLKHDQTLTSRLNGYVNYNRVGDNDYFRDLGNSVNVTSQANLLQEGGLNYDAGWWTSMGRVQHYQTLQDPAAPIAVPYTRLPQLTLNANKNYAGANIAFAGEYVNFSHPTEVNANRLVLNPSVSYPLVSQPAFYVTPKLAMHSAYTRWVRIMLELYRMNQAPCRFLVWTVVSHSSVRGICSKMIMFRPSSRAPFMCIYPTKINRNCRISTRHKPISVLPRCSWRTGSTAATVSAITIPSPWH